MIENEDIKEALETLSVFGLWDKTPLEFKRWNIFLETYKFSGTQRLPIKLFGRIWREPFYYFFEKIGNQELFFVKPIRGEPYREGDVFKFFGFTAFKDWSLDNPIILVEGPADLICMKKFWKHSLCTLTSGVSRAQLFYLMNITNNIWTAFDNDNAGRHATLEFSKIWYDIGRGQHRSIECPLQDWGKVLEEENVFREAEQLMKFHLENVHVVDVSSK